MKIGLHSSQRRFQPRCATAAVELAVILPFVALLIVGLLEVARIVQVSQILSNAAREGARKASTGVNTYSDVQTTVANYLTNAGITNQNGLTVNVYDVTQGNAGPSFNPSTANQLDQLQVIVTLPYSNVQLTTLYLASTDANTSMTAQAVWFSNQNQSYPATIIPPAGN
jgi:Flp pilus assembly protein TadG